MNTTNFKPIIFLLLLISLFSTQLFTQNDYYVSPSGNDANVGTESNPSLTIQVAIDNHDVDNGDIIVKDDSPTNPEKKDVPPKSIEIIENEGGSIKTDNIEINIPLSTFNSSHKMKIVKCTEDNLFGSTVVGENNFVNNVNSGTNARQLMKIQDLSTFLIASILTIIN